MAVEKKSEEQQEWTVETRALAACLEALLQVGKGGASAAAANDAAQGQGSASCANPSERIAREFQQE